MAGVILNRLNIFGGAARLVRNPSLTNQPTKIEDIVDTGAKGGSRGDLQSGWVDIGATDDGLTLTVSWEGEEWTVDQSRFPVKEQITGASYILSTNLAENSIENLKFGWDLPESIEAVAAVSGTNYAQHTVALGIPGSFTEQQLAFIVEKPTSSGDTLYRVYAFYIVSRAAEDSEHAYNKNDKTLIPITFRAKPDTSKSDTQSIGIVLDEDWPV